MGVVGSAIDWMFQTMGVFAIGPLTIGWVAVLWVTFMFIDFVFGRDYR